MYFLSIRRLVCCRTLNHSFPQFLNLRYLYFLTHAQIDPDQNLRQWALCFYCDLVEFCGSESYDYADVFTGLVIAALSDTPNVRQPACYAIGLFALCGGIKYAPICIETLPKLFAIVHEDGARDEDNLYATDNAVSAIGKICFSFRGEFNSTPVIRKWVQELPILHDVTEGSFAVGKLLGLVKEYVCENLISAEGFLLMMRKYSRFSRMSCTVIC
jgi:hypothetical protein